MDEPASKRKSLDTVLSRALRLRCPRCGNGRLFAGWFRMHPDCQSCHLHYERAPGYFLGSAYINYALTATTLTALYIGLHFGAGLQNRILAVPLAAYCVLFPLSFFRFARSLWLALDCYFDVTGFEHDRE